MWFYLSGIWQLEFGGALNRKPHKDSLEWKDPSFVLWENPVPQVC